MKDSEHTDQKVAQVASAPPGPLVRCEDEAHGDQAERWTNRAGWSGLGYEWFLRRTTLLASEREEVCKLQEDRSNAEIEKTAAEATKAVEKATTEAQSCTAEVHEGSDGTLSSRMNSPTEQFEKSNEAILSRQHSRTSHRGRESEHFARHHAKRE